MNNNNYLVSLNEGDYFLIDKDPYNCLRKILSFNSKKIFYFNESLGIDGTVRGNIVHITKLTEHEVKSYRLLYE